MFSRLAAILIAWIVLGLPFASWGQVRSDAPPSAGQVEAVLSADPAQENQAGPADPELPDESTPASSELEGGSDLPEGVACLADPRLPALPMARPRPLAAAAWRAPTLDGLRRPPRAALLSAA